MQKDAFRPSKYSDHDNDAFDALRDSLPEEPMGAEEVERRRYGWRELSPLKKGRKRKTYARAR